MGNQEEGIGKTKDVEIELRKKEEGNKANEKAERVELSSHNVESYGFYPRPPDKMQRQKMIIIK